MIIPLKLTSNEDYLLILAIQEEAVEGEVPNYLEDAFVMINKKERKKVCKRNDYWMTNRYICTIIRSTRRRRRRWWGVSFYKGINRGIVIERILRNNRKRSRNNANVIKNDERITFSSRWRRRYTLKDRERSFVRELICYIC